MEAEKMKNYSRILIPFLAIIFMACTQPRHNDKNAPSTYKYDMTDFVRRDGLLCNTNTKKSTKKSYNDQKWVDYVATRPSLLVDSILYSVDKCDVNEIFGIKHNVEYEESTLFMFVAESPLVNKNYCWDSTENDNWFDVKYPEQISDIDLGFKTIYLISDSNMDIEAKYCFGQMGHLIITNQWIESFFTKKRKRFQMDVELRLDGYTVVWKFVTFNGRVIDGSVRLNDYYDGYDCIFNMKSKDIKYLKQN